MSLSALESVDWRQSSIALTIVGTVSLLFVFSVPGQLHTVQPYSDHARHTFASLTAVSDPVRVYTQPIAAWPSSYGLPETRSWETLGHMYPPTSLLLFLPGVVASYVGIPPNVVFGGYVALFGFCGLVDTYLLYDTLREKTGEAFALVAAIPAGTILVWWGFNAFFDTVVLLIILVAIRSLRRERYDYATILFAVGLSMHFRAWYLGPLAVYAAYKHVETNGLFERPVPLVVAGVTGGYSVASLLLLQTNGLSIADSPNIHINRFSVISVDPGWLLFALFGVGVVAVAVAEWSLPAVSVYALSLVEVLVLPQWMWWYPVLFLPLVVVLQTDRGRALALVTVLQLQLLLGHPSTTLKVLDILRKGVSG